MDEIGAVRTIAQTASIGYVISKLSKGIMIMADHSKSGPLETGAPMDYSEHDRTYKYFLIGAKYGTIGCVSLLAAMGFGFFIGGWFSGTILFIVLCAAGAIML